MNKLKEVISEYGHWRELEQYIQRIESFYEIDFSQTLGNCKALLESIGKEICAQNGIELGSKSSINTVLKKAFSSMGFSNADYVIQISSSLATIAQQIGNLRNELDPNAHGKTMEELKQRNDKIDILAREFLKNAVESIAVLLIRTFESQKNRTPHETLIDTLAYLEAEEFNESWDDSFGEFTMGEYSYTASEILFYVDKQAYVNEYMAYIENKE